MMRCPARPSSSIPPGRGDAEAAEQQAEDIAVTLVRQALKEHKGSKHPVVVLARAQPSGQPDAPVDAGGHQLPRGGPGAAGPAASGGGSGATAAGAVASGRPAGLAVGAARAVLRPDADPLQRLFGEDHVTPVPVLLEQLREPDPESAASQTPAQGSLFDAALRGGRGPGGPRARDVLGADEYERLRQAAAVLLDARNDSGAMPFAAWVEACWRRLGGPALYTGYPSPTTRKACSSWSSAWRRTARSTWPRWKPASRGCSPRLTRPARTARSRSTMHKSKGLQFETVILYGLHRRSARRPGAAGALRAERRPGAVRPGRRAPRPRPIPCPATPARARRAARPMRWTGCCTWPPRARASACIWSAMSVDDAGQAKAPPAASLLGRLWPG